MGVVLPGLTAIIIFVLGNHLVKQRKNREENRRLNDIKDVIIATLKDFKGTCEKQKIYIDESLATKNKSEVNLTISASLNLRSLEEINHLDIYKIFRYENSIEQIKEFRSIIQLGNTIKGHIEKTYNDFRDKLLLIDQEWLSGFEILYNEYQKLGNLFRSNPNSTQSPVISQLLNVWNEGIEKINQSDQNNENQGQSESNEEKELHAINDFKESFMIEIVNKFKRIIESGDQSVSSLQNLYRSCLRFASIHVVYIMNRNELVNNSEHSKGLLNEMINSIDKLIQSIRGESN